MTCDRCKNRGTLKFVNDAGEEMERLCPDCKGASWMAGALREVKGDRLDRPKRKHFWQEWGEIDAGAQVLVLAAFGFGIWFIYMVATTASKF